MKHIEACHLLDRYEAALVSRCKAEEEMEEHARMMGADPDKRDAAMAEMKTATLVLFTNKCHSIRLQILNAMDHVSAREDEK